MKLAGGLILVALLVALVGVSAAGGPDEGSDAPVRVSAPTSTSTTSTTAPPSQVMPWISTTVEPNTRTVFVRTIPATGVHDAPHCTLDDLTVTASFGGAGGEEGADIKVRNRTAYACVVRGSPYVAILDVNGRTLGVYPPQQSTGDAITLAPGSWAAVGLTPIGADRCGGPDNFAFGGTLAAAIAFGIDATATRVVRSTGDGPSPHGCPVSPAGNHTGPFEAIGSVTDFEIGMFFSALRSGVTVSAPRRIRARDLLRYSVTVTNRDANALPLIGDNCPLYEQSLGRTTSPPLLLNCGDGLLIAPGSSVRFEMQFAVPPDQPLGASTLRWQFVEPHEPAVTAPLVVDPAPAPPTEHA